jgi:imidazolonepropionase-like amidohydrolase
VPDRIVFRGARVFDGRAESLAGPVDVVVEGDTIAAITAPGVRVDEPAATLDCGNRTLMPGLIDLHTHPTLNIPWRMPGASSPWVRGMALAKTLEMYLEHGFTTIRETGGGCTGDVARACDRGMVRGPRLYPGGSFLSQTSGHGDLRAAGIQHPQLQGCCGDVSQGGISFLVDGPDEVRRAARENLRLGATQLKIMAGGGVASLSDPIHTTQFRPEEIRAAVEVAEDWGTYVSAHLYHDRSAIRCLDSGVRCIEHGHLLTERVVERCGREGIPIVSQLVTYVAMGETASEMGLTETNARKNQQVLESLGALFEKIRACGVKVGYSTDLIAGAQHQVSREFTLRKPHFSNAEILRQATSESAEIVRMCGPLNPYGNFGEVREGWLADLIVVDGNPLDDVSLLEDFQHNIRVIMKNGEVFKNTLAR